MSLGERTRMLGVEEIRVRMGKFTFRPTFRHNATNGVFSKGCVENKGLEMAPQVGFGSEYSIDSIGSCWFYCNASNVFVQKCLVCTANLSHVRSEERRVGKE